MASGRQRCDRERAQIVNLYAKRWTIEPGFRDTKDLRFGMGLSVLRIGDPQRRDRLLLLNALAILLLTLLGAAGESLGMDRSLRTSTVKRRVHSLFRQGCLLYDLIPNMPEQRLRPLVEKYEEFLNQNNVFTQTFGPSSSASPPQRSKTDYERSGPLCGSGSNRDLRPSSTKRYRRHLASEAEKSPFAKGPADREGRTKRDRARHSQREADRNFLHESIVPEGPGAGY